jgi:predicted histone-like DNA-binding protein
MALKVKAKEKLLKFSKQSEGSWRYVMVPDLYSSLAQDKVIREAALRSGVSQGVMQACWDAAGQVIKAWATEGHSVALPGLGTMRFGLSATAVENVNDVKSGLIKTRRIIFTPSIDLKDELKNTAIVITCYDRNGNEVKRVTSSDDGTVENNEDNGDDNGVDNGSTENGGTSGGNTSGNSGSVTQGVTAPTFSGNTQFTESTQVSMSGPSGAEIRYTTDGSQPTAQSTLYSGPLTLTETTTVKAIAIKDGNSSSVTSRTYSKVEPGGGGGESGDME